MYLSHTSKVEERETIKGNMVAAIATLGSRIPRNQRARFARRWHAVAMLHNFQFYMGNLAVRVHRVSMASARTPAHHLFLFIGILKVSLALSVVC